MSRGVNKVILLGHLGADPEVRYSANGLAVANIRVATTASRKDPQTGQWQEEAEWHRVVFFGKLAETANQYLRKGKQVYIEGRLKTNKWQDKEGNTRYSTDIIADEMVMLGGRSDQEIANIAALPDKENFAAIPPANMNPAVSVNEPAMNPPATYSTPTGTVKSSSSAGKPFSDDDVPF